MPQTHAIARHNSSSAYSVIYSFKGVPDGMGPIAAVTALKGKLYGTTVGDGGTVYKVTTGGTETVLHHFDPNRGDVEDPEGNLLAVGGTLYGTGYVGGPHLHSQGGIFSITRAGHERVIYSFKSKSSDLCCPRGGLTLLKGKMFGTASDGGLGGGYGGIFKVTMAGEERDIYRFKGAPDGFGPADNLTAHKGVLYGATKAGGAHDDGTIFSVTPSGNEQVLYSFKGSPKDGASPNSLMILDGVLYGTTAAGGSDASCDNGCGTVFSFTLDGKEHVLHDFSASDGTKPGAGLVPYKGYLYGTTCAGGSYGGFECYDRVGYGYGFGTIFRISPTGKFTVEYEFGGQPDGALSVAPLYLLNGSLYGTTQAGGSAGYGTVFRFTP